MQHISESAIETDFSETLDIGQSKTDETEAEPSHDLQPLFPWKFEFSWESDKLKFADDDLEVNRCLELRSSEDSMGSCVGIAASDRTPVDSPASVADSVDSLMARPLQVDLDDDEMSSILSDISSYLISILDDRYWRTRGPQRSTNARGKARQDGRENRSANPYSRNTSHSTRSRPQRQSGRGNTNGSENNGEDDDDDSGNNDQPHGPTADSRGISRRVDCPFYKRQPGLFVECCGAGYIKISHLKQHLKAKHRDPHCKKCLVMMAPKYLEQHTCTKKLNPKDVMFITDDALDRIKERADGKKSLKEKWLHIYKIIFPSEAGPYPDPYVQPQAHVHANYLESFLQQNISGARQEIKKHLLQQSFVGHNGLEEAIDKGCKAWLSKTMHFYRSQHANYDNKWDSETNNLSTFDIAEQSANHESAPQTWDCHQPMETGPSSLSLQNATHSASDVHTGLQSDIYNGGWIDTPDMTINVTDNKTPAFSPFDFSTSNNMPSVEPLLQQQHPNFDPYSGPWHHTSSVFFNGNIEPNYTQPDLLSFSNPFPISNGFLPGTFTGWNEQSLGYSNTKEAQAPR
ncbi:hypothetical protein Hte_002671 [Hypoxylon texense]